MRTAFAAMIVLTSASCVQGCNCVTCDDTACPSGVTVSLYNADGSPIADGVWTASAGPGDASYQVAFCTIRGGKTSSCNSMSEVDVNGRVQELFFTIYGKPSRVEIAVTRDGSAVTSQTFDSISYQHAGDTPACGGCEVAKERVPLP